ncbi:MAG TPA: AMP-binding protein, partial [Gemmatimonadales bacterium]|nr:AMP-binding protein [Gemmatimonadales bacterium]
VTTRDEARPDALAALLLQHTTRSPDRVALAREGGTCTYAELGAQVAAAADRLRAHGLTPGGRVALWLPNGPALVVQYLAVLSAGGTAVLLGERWAADEVVHALDLARPALGVTTPELLTQLPADAGACFRTERARGPAPAEQGTLPAQILFSSGTTGRPKGVALSAGNAAFVVRAKIAAFGLTEADRLPLVVPLTHCYGLNAILGPALAAGATVVLRTGLPEGRGAAWLRDVGATVLCAVPGTYRRLVDEGDLALPALRMAFSAAAPLPPELGERWLRATGQAIHQGYGLTESAPFATWEPEPGRYPDAVGLPVPGVEVRITDPERGTPVADGAAGEVELRGPNVMLGYVGDAEATAAAVRDGWLRTGDIGRLDAAGRLRLTGRLKEMINVNGLKAWPAEIERVLGAHPGVAEVAAFGVADAATGERVEAAVVAPGAPADLADRLVRHARTHLAPHKVPRRIHLLSQLPRNATGKLRRGELTRVFSPTSLP